MAGSSASSAGTAVAPPRSRHRPLDTAQRQSVLQAKLRVLVASRWPGADPELAPFPGGAAARRPGVGWVLAAERPASALGGAMAWGRRAGVGELHVLVDDGAGELARRASQFVSPPVVWRIDGRDLVAAEPAPIGPEPPLPPDAAAFVAMIETAGADPVVEHGVLRAEVLGLEVARVVSDHEGTRIEVGVGAFDREAQRMVHGDRPADQSLAAAVAAVRSVRRPDAPSHQVNQLALERWMRAVLVRRPALVGATSLTLAPSPVIRTDLRQRAPAPATGADGDGRPLLVVCSTGIDVDLVPAAADARLADGRGARLVLVVPEADDHPLTRTLADALVEPAGVVTLPGGWRAL